MSTYTRSNIHVSKAKKLLILRIQRLTYLLRPNVTRPDRHAQNTLDTPPVTDLDYTSHEHESDFASEPPSGSDVDVDSDTEAHNISSVTATAGLTAIAESPATSVQALEPDQEPEPEYDEEWSVVGDTDVEGDESGSDHGLVASVDSLSIQEGADIDLDSTPRAIATAAVRHNASLRSRVWDHRQGRSASSPSRSPARRIASRRGRPRVEPPRSKGAHPKSFYNYLYS